MEQRRNNMNKKYRKLNIMLIAAIAILFSGIYASADEGRGYGHHRRMEQGLGWHHRGDGGPGCGASDNLSEDEIKKLDVERTAFFEATKGLRRKIYQKRLELASELAKENPDAAAAAALQTEISDFKAQLAQKRLDHILRVQKINPDLGRGFGGGGLAGPGMMHRGMMGRGGKGSWGPNNCPYGGPGGGYGKGPRGGYGRGLGMMGPGGSDRGNSRQYYRGQGSQAD
jgi:Spy/CpxP family protein refolding chaperone